DRMAADRARTSPEPATQPPVATELHSTQRAPETSAPQAEELMGESADGTRGRAPQAAELNGEPTTPDGDDGQAGELGAGDLTVTVELFRRNYRQQHTEQRNRLQNEAHNAKAAITQRLETALG